MRPQLSLDLRMTENINNEYNSYPSPQSPHTPHSPPSKAFTFATSPTSGKQVKCIGDYMLGKKLGRGSFCKVRVATHIQTGCKV